MTDVEYRLTLSVQPRTPGYLFLCPVAEVCSGNPPRVRLPDCPFYWSLDPTGAGRLTHYVQDLGFPIIDIEMEVMGHSWDGMAYGGLAQFHYGKGFHPYSQNVARNLGFSPYQVSAPFAHGELKFDRTPAESLMDMDSKRVGYSSGHHGKRPDHPNN